MPCSGRWTNAEARTGFLRLQRDGKRCARRRASHLELGRAGFKYKELLSNLSLPASVRW